MKKFFIVLLMHAFALGMHGQGVLLQPLGSLQEDVHNFLKEQKIALADFSNPNLLSVSTATYSIYYHFKAARLYKTEVVRNYKNRKQVLQRIECIRTYLSSLELDVLDLSQKKNQISFAALNGDELHEVNQIHLGKNGFQLKQVRLDLGACPNEELSLVKYQLNPLIGD